MRKIYLPELVSINIQDFTLYPNGLNFEYDFVKGVNFILGGNGMGKTTFVNIIKYSIIGHYKKPYDYTRTYKDQIIERRTPYPIDYFKNRMDSDINLNRIPFVTIKFKINNKLFVVKRDLQNIQLEFLSVDGIKIDAPIITQSKYESLKTESDKSLFLHYKYEKLVEKYSGLPFDDLIFFVNEILFFGEDHKTILWSDGTRSDDVQNELFNKYFNSPELDKQRQEALRQAKYYDSLSRHRSEDIRAIRKVLEKVDNKKNSKTISIETILNLKKEIEIVENRIKNVQTDRVDNNKKVSILRNKLNELSIQVNSLETEKNQIESRLSSKAWETLHPLYEVFTKNIKNNHICPLCNKPNEKLFSKLLNNTKCCFVCETKFDEIQDENLQSIYNNISNKYKNHHEKIITIQKELRSLDEDMKIYDKEFHLLDSQKRKLLSSVRDLEFMSSQNNEVSDLQPFYDEIDKLEKEKQENQEKSKNEMMKAEKFSQEIESQIIQNTNKFSSLFSNFAESFLGVSCSLTFENFDTQSNRRFYPVINGKIRFDEEQLSESQRFFIDHSFRMSILSFFYTTPTFYIVETPDSSLDISYEKNAAMVFLRFLEKTNSLIITSNLNNSSFIDYIINNKNKVKVSIVGLLDIAKKSVIQNTSETLLYIYNELKNKVEKIKYDR